MTFFFFKSLEFSFSEFYNKFLDFRPNLFVYSTKCIVEAKCKFECLKMRKVLNSASFQYNHLLYSFQNWLCFQREIRVGWGGVQNVTAAISITLSLALLHEG